MRVLLASYFVLPNAGGLWTYIDQLRRGLERMGHEVDVIAQHPEDRYHLLDKGLTFDKKQARPLIEKMVVNAWKQHALPLDEGILELETERYLLEAALAYFGLRKYDIIHSQDIISTRAAARVKARRTPLVATIHGCLSSEALHHGEVAAKESLHYEYLVAHEKIGMLSAQEVIVPSQWIKNLFVEQFGVPEGYLNVVMNGMNIETFAERMHERSEMVHPGDKKVIACNARLDPIKGHEHLFEALARLKAERSDWVCWLIGDGELREELEARCQALGLQEQVLFLGTRSDVPALLRAADICVLPSLQENCPFAVMEAQVAGRTIIASAVGGVPEMILHEVTGLLVEAGVSEALFANLCRALEEEDFCRELGQRAKKWGRRQWSLDTMQAQTLEVYQRAIRQQIAGRRRGEA